MIRNDNSPPTVSRKSKIRSIIVENFFDCEEDYSKGNCNELPINVINAMHYW